MSLRHWTLVVCLTALSAADLQAQRLFAGVDFTTRFDNREYAGTYGGTSATRWPWRSTCCRTSATEATF